MPATRPRASFEPVPPDFNLNALVESTPNFTYVDRISCDMIDQNGIEAFEKLVTLHVVVGGKPLVIEGFENRLDPWTFSAKWLRDNCGDKVENARNLTTKESLPLTMGHYLKNMGVLADQFFDKPGAYKDKRRQRVYLKDIDCPPVWWDKVSEKIPGALSYLNESTGIAGGPGAVPDAQSNGRLGKGIARAGDLMSSLPPDMRAENLMCYIGHEGTYTPAHREMCASLGHNIMVEASNTVSADDGKPEKPGSSIWFMTESKDKKVVSEYWLSVLGHDIEVESHFAQIVAWKKAPFNVYVVEQRPGDFILIPPLAPHQVWNRGSRTMKVAWNRTTVETLEMALHDALPNSRIVCRDEQYKNKAIIYYTLQKYSGLLALAQQQASQLPPQHAYQFLYTGKIRQLQRDFKRLFNLYREILLSEMFNPEDRDTPKNIEYLPFDSNVTCAYCRSNVFNRFLTCPSCKDLLGHGEEDTEGDPYDVCMDCYAMGRSCACISNLKWVEQFRWKELASKYDTWRKLIVTLDGGEITDRTPLPLVDERRRQTKRTLAEVCKEQLKRRPFKDVHKSLDEPKSDAEDDDEEIIVGDDGTVKKIKKKRSKAWLKNNIPCHICCHRHPSWRMASCTKCDRSFCYGSLFRGWDKMPTEIMENPDWECPHCLGICFAGACRREGKMIPYEPKGTLLGHDTKKVADVRSVESLVDFSVSNLNWLKDDNAVNKTETSRLKRAKADAQKAKDQDPTIDDDEEEVAATEDVEQTQVYFENSPQSGTQIDPALTGGTPVNEMDDAYFASRLQQATSALPPPAAMVAGAPVRGAPDGYAPVLTAGYIPPTATMYNQPDNEESYVYPGHHRPTSVEPMDQDGDGDISTFQSLGRKRARPEDEADGDFGDISMTKGGKNKKQKTAALPRMSAAGFRSSDLADLGKTTSKAKNEAQRQYEKEKERKALDKAKAEGRFIMLSARLKGKKRIVKLNVPGARLAQLLAQQAAKAALASGGDDNAAHEVDDAAPAQPHEGTADGSIDLLQSDIAPKKSEANRERLSREGAYSINPITKKALIPVDRDEAYGYNPKHAKDGKTTSAGGKKKKTNYDEVSVGSWGESDSGLFMPDEVVPTAKDRRSLPSYRRARRDEDDEDFPAALPDDFRDGQVSRSNRPKAAPTTAETRGSDGKSSGRVRLNPEAASTVSNGVEEDEDHERLNANGVPTLPATANGHNPKPSKSKVLSPKTQKIRKMEEDNRRAKMMAADMLEVDDDASTSAAPLPPPPRSNGNGNVNGHANGKKNITHPGARNALAINIVDSDPEDEEESSDDGIDSIAAKPAVSVKAR